MAGCFGSERPWRDPQVADRVGTGQRSSEGGSEHGRVEEGASSRLAARTGVSPAANRRRDRPLARWGVPVAVPSTGYRMRHRQGGRKLAPAKRHPKADLAAHGGRGDSPRRSLNSSPDNLRGLPLPPYAMHPHSSGRTPGGITFGKRLSTIGSFTVSTPWRIPCSAGIGSRVRSPSPLE